MSNSISIIWHYTSIFFFFIGYINQDIIEQHAREQEAQERGRHTGPYDNMAKEEEQVIKAINVLVT